MASQKISIIILGDGAVGKTSLLKMYDEKKFQPAHMATLGLDYISKTYNPKDGGKACAVKIWDTAGQERFRTLTHSFYKQGHGIIIAFAVNDIGTFQSVQTWLNSIKEHADPNVIKILVGNKCDLEGERKVSYEEANKLAQENNMHYYDTSAKNDMNIDAFMDDLIGQVHDQKFGDPTSKREPTVVISKASESAVQDKKKDKKKGCC